MLKKFCSTVTQSKNILMLLTVAVYIFALFITLSEHLLVGMTLMTVVLLYLLIKNLFPAKYVLILTLIFYTGIINTSFRLRDIDELRNLAPLNSTISGTIVSIPQGKTEGKPKFFFDVDNIQFNNKNLTLKSERVLVTITLPPDSQKSLKDLRPYDSYLLTGRLSAPFKAGNPSQFDYSNYLRNHNAYAVFYAKDFTKLDKNLSIKSKFLQRINDYREHILALHSKYLKTPNLEILGGIVFGDDAVSPPKEIKQSFINSGLLHILAASGMNVAFIYGFFFLIMSWLRIGFKTRVVISMITVVIYSLMTGLGASVIRATCMLLFVLIGKLIDRDAHSIALLSFVGLLMLIYNPLFINDVGFQLSFIVTFGILMMSGFFAKFKNKFIDFTVSTVTIPIIAQLWVIPIQIFYFNNISIYSIFANIMSVPILMVISFGGFVSSLLAIINPIADFICKIFDTILNPLITLLINISDFWGKLPNSALQTSHPNVFQIILYYIILLAISGYMYKDFREKYSNKLTKTIVITALILLLTLIPIKNSNLEVTAFDVGNADCFLIKTPSNKYLMIDTGKSGYKGGKTQAEIIVLKYLKDRGIKSIDSIILSHFDNDHCGGAVDLIKNIKVKKIYVNSLDHKSIEASRIYSSSKEKGTEIFLAKNNQSVYNLDGLKIFNYTKEIGDSDNENSIITYLEYKNFSMLFTGDSTTEGLKSILKNNIKQKITVLKVPHHGAIGGLDKEVISSLNPQYALISVGENKFGHPAVYTLKLLENTTILRTDFNNSIRFIVKPNKTEVLTYDIRKRKYKKFPIHSAK